jgi:hypothetical protein
MNMDAAEIAVARDAPLDAEFEAQLARSAAKYQGDPRGELVALLLLALEREQIVAVAYTDKVVEARVATLTAGRALREIVRRGIAWAWRDQEKHAIYTRGILLGFAPFGVRMSAWASQVAPEAPGPAPGVRPVDCQRADARSATPHAPA